MDTEYPGKADAHFAVFFCVQRFVELAHAYTSVYQVITGATALTQKLVYHWTLPVKGLTEYRFKVLAALLLTCSIRLG